MNYERSFKKSKDLLVDLLNCMSYIMVHMVGNLILIFLEALNFLEMQRLIIHVFLTQ